MKSLIVLIGDAWRNVLYFFESDRWIYPLIWFSIGYFLGLA